MKVTLEEPDTTGKRDAVVCFKDSQAVMEIFSQIPTAFCTYAVEIKPSIPSVSIISYFSNLQVQKKNTFYNSFEEKYDSKQALHIIMEGRL